MEINKITGRLREREGEREEGREGEREKQTPSLLCLRLTVEKQYLSHVRMYQPHERQQEINQDCFM